VGLLITGQLGGSAQVLCQRCPFVDVHSRFGVPEVELHHQGLISTTPAKLTGSSNAACDSCGTGASQRMLFKTKRILP